MFLEQPPAQRDIQSLKDLLQAYAVAIELELPPPPDAPPAAEIEAALRTAAVERLPREWRAYLGFQVARGACAMGNLPAMSRAAAELEALSRDEPDLAYYAPQRQLLLADLQRALGNFAEALRAVDLLQVDPAVQADLALHSDVLGVRSEVLRETGRLDDAAKMVGESLALARASGDPEAVERALLRSQAMALATGDFKVACKAIEKQLVALDPADAASRALFLVFLGYAQSGVADEDAEALANAKQTLDEARRLARGHLQVRADLKRVDLALRAGDVPAAIQALADCERSLGPIRSSGELPRDDIERIGLVTRLLLLRRADGEELRKWLPQQQRAQRALAEELQQQPPRRGGIGFLHLGQRRELLADGIALELLLAASEGRVDGAARALQILLDLQVETSLARARGAPPCLVADLQRGLLADGRGALVLLPSRRVTFALLVDGAGVQCFELASGSALTKVCGSAASKLLRSPVVKGPDRELRNKSLRDVLRAAAVQLLPPPLLARIRVLNGLTVVGSDLLEGLPFEALALEGGELLGEVLPIDNSASLPLTAWLTQTAKPVSLKAVKVAFVACTQPQDASHAKGVVPFVFPIEELQPALRGYEAPRVFIDSAATRASLLARSTEECGILHVIAHHVPGVDEASGGRLLLYDGAVNRDDLDGHTLQGLIIVSACGGGQGPLRSGEGEAFASFAGMFLWKGAQAVIASRNELLVLDHLRLMERVHRGLCEGNSPARALQLARASLAEGADLVLRTNRAVVQVFGAGQVPLLKD